MLTTTANIVEDIRRFLRGKVWRDVSMQDLTSFRIGGPADVVVEPCDVEDMAALRAFLSGMGVPNTLLGAGTNVLCSDRGYRGVVVRTLGLKWTKTAGNGFGSARIAAGAGVRLISLTSRACRAGWEGMEPLWGIPGSIGGAIAMNAGAGEVATCNFLEGLRLVTRDGSEIHLKMSDLNFGYRRMDLPSDAVVVEGIFRLVIGDRKDIKERLRYWVGMRKERQPWRLPSAGCIFKNPDKGEPAGAIIDQLGFKGASEGEAQVSPVHANFIVNRGGATADEVLRLIRRIRNRVSKERHTDLKLEIKLLGEGLENADE